MPSANSHSVPIPTPLRLRGVRASSQTTSEERPEAEHMTPEMGLGRLGRELQVPWHHLSRYHGDTGSGYASPLGPTDMFLHGEGCGWRMTKVAPSTAQAQCTPLAWGLGTVLEEEASFC